MDSKQIESLARLYRNSDYRALEMWLESQLDAGFQKILRKNPECDRAELASELRAYKRVLSQVKEAWEQQQGN